MTLVSKAFFAYKLQQGFSQIEEFTLAIKGIAHFLRALVNDAFLSIPGK